MPLMSYIVPPRGNDRAFKIIARVPGFDRPVKIQGDRQRGRTATLQARVDALIEAKEDHQPPPRELAGWIESLDKTTANRLTALGLLNRQRVEAVKSIADHVADYRAAVKARRGNTEGHATKQARMVELVCEALKVDLFNDLNQTDVLVTIDGWEISNSTKRHYIIAVRDFTAWMKRDKRTHEDPMDGAELPDASEDHDRRPLTFEEFERLMTYLSGPDAYQPARLSYWTPAARRLVYWLAVSTAFRKTEIVTRLKHHFHLTTATPWVEIGAKDAKNRTAGSIEIKPDLAEALKIHLKELANDAPAFQFPESKALLGVLRRDLAAAGIETDGGDGKTIDFHSLRATAITWWLLAGIDQLNVQRLARLKTLSQVQRYSRNFRRPASGAWLDKLPSFGNSGADSGSPSSPGLPKSTGREANKTGAA